MRTRRTRARAGLAGPRLPGPRLPGPGLPGPGLPAARAPVPLGPTLLGLTGAVVVALAAPRLVADPVRWWFSLDLGGAARGLLYAGMLALVGAWAWLGRELRAGARLTSRRLAAVGALWSLPLLASPPLFSHDLYSYLAQGWIARLGLDPYHVAPSALAGLGHPGVLDAVSPFWRRTTAPYGPLFLALVRTVVGVTGSGLVAGAVAVRLVVAGVGLGLLAAYLPRLARRLGGSPAGAVWLVMLNPLVLFQLVAPGHNDLLMAGVMVAGVTVALSGAPLLGIVVCALAATVKLPALVAAAFIAASWIRDAPDGTRARRAAWAALAVAITLAVVSAASGLGFGWISGGVFTTPRRVHLAITPGTALGWTLATGLRGAGLGVDVRSLESGCGLLALGLVAALALRSLWDVRWPGLAVRLAVVLVAFALGGPAAWPWYLSWGLVLLVCAPRRAWSTGAIAAASVLGAFVVKPDGILALPIQSAPAVLCLYLACGGIAWWAWLRRRAAVAVAVAEAGTGGEVPEPGELALR